jgi:hypothetical protein
MRLVVTPFFCLGLCLLSAVNCLAASAPAPAKLLERAPIRFEPNSGLRPGPIRWTARGRGYSFAFSDSATLLRVADRTVRLTFPGSNLAPSKRSSANHRFQGEQQQRAPTNYFLGLKNNEQKRLSVPAFARLRESGVYRGIDVVYYGNGGELEYDFEIAPGADPSRIRMRFEGADAVRLNDRGEIVLMLDSGEIVQHPPVVYQRRASGEIVNVAAAYRIARDGTVRLALAGYNPDEPLIVDPSISYAAYLSGAIADFGLAIAHDSQGILYLAGNTYSVDFPNTSNAYQAANAGNLDIWLMKLDPNGGSNAIVYSSYLGGPANDMMEAMTIDQNGVFYITGSSTSGDFPVSTGALISTNSALIVTGFVSMIDPTQGTSGLIYSSYIGGSTTGDTDEGDGIAVANGKIYVTGITTSADFPIVGTPYQPTIAGSADAFVVEIDPTQSGNASEVQATYLGGVADDRGRTIAVDAAGLVYVAGTTSSFGFPVVINAYQQAYAGGGDGFLSVLNLNTGGLVYSTFLGGSSEDEVKKMVIDPAGNVAMTGYTLSGDFPVTQNAYQTAFGGVSNAFLAILNIQASQLGVGLTYSTYYGGSGGEVAYDLKLDAYGRYYLCGYTVSQNLPVTPDALYTSSFGAGNDGFIAVIDPSASRASGNGLVYATYITSLGSAAVYGVDVLNAPAGSASARATAGRSLDGPSIEHHAGTNPIVQIYSTGSATSNIFPGDSPPNNSTGKSSAFVMGIELQAPAASLTGSEAPATLHRIHP